MLIAIDGPAASGKGTIARKLAEKLGLEYLDTGKLYRAVGKAMLRAGVDFDKADSEGFEYSAIMACNNLKNQQFSDEELETEEVGRAASIVSSIPEVRRALLDFQRDVAKSPNGAVLDGRDIGTVICPDADFKFYITAKAEIRAKRRYQQLQNKNKDVIEADVLRDILERDARDKGRTSSPLQVSEGATRIDTTEMSIEEVFEEILNVVKPSA